MTCLQQVHIGSVDVEVTKDLLDIDPFAKPHTSRRHTPYPIFEARPRSFTVLPQYSIKGK